MSYGDVCKEITPETGQTNRLESNQLKTQFMHPAATGAENYDADLLTCDCWTHKKNSKPYWNEAIGKQV